MVYQGTEIILDMTYTKTALTLSNCDSYITIVAVAIGNGEVLLLGFEK
jgi:hypothetical protein